MMFTSGGEIGARCEVVDRRAADSRYSQLQSVGTLTCGSEPTGMTCTDSGTGHYFRTSRETYELD